MRETSSKSRQFRQARRRCIEDRQRPGEPGGIELAPFLPPQKELSRCL